jgi:hypothetical protein
MGGSNEDGNTHASIDISTDLEVGFLPFLIKQAGSFFNKVLASSLPRRPFVDTTKGERYRRCSRQGSRCFFFFSRSWAANTLLSALERFDLASTSVKRTSTMQSASRGPEPSNQHVATVFIAIVAKQTLDWVVIGYFNLFRFRLATTEVD